MTGIRWGFTFLMGVESGWRLQRSTVRCNPRQRYRRRKTSPALSRQRTNTAPGNGLFRQLEFAYIFVPEFRMALDEIRHHLNAGRIFKHDDGDSVRPE